MSAIPAAPETLDELLKKTVDAFNDMAVDIKSVRSITIDDLTADTPLSLSIPPYMYWRSAAMLYATQDMGLLLNDVLVVFQGDKNANEAMIERSFRAILQGGMPIYEPYAKAYTSLCRQLNCTPAVKVARPPEDIVEEVPPQEPDAPIEAMPQDQNNEVKKETPATLDNAVSLPDAATITIDETRTSFSAKEIKSAVLKAWNDLYKTSVTIKDFDSKERSRRIARPRQFSMYVSKVLAKHNSFPEIGRQHGGRDHTTALHSVRKIVGLLDRDKEPTIAFLKAVSKNLGCTEELEEKLITAVGTSPRAGL